MTILEEIINYKKLEVASAIKKIPVSKLEKGKFFKRQPLKLTDSILNQDRNGIIAEFKRKSPSKGIINSNSTIEEVTTGYFRWGASGLSILTDSKFFGGSLADLKRAREIIPIPILRKDFIISEYQIIEARSIGADVILLIAAALSRTQCIQLARFAKSLELQVLLEIHDAEEIDYLNEDIDIVGVNNRDLKSFNVDIERSVELSGLIPAEFIKISESGISTTYAIKRLKGFGYNGFLIGENFMKYTEPATAFADFIKKLTFGDD